MDCSRLMLGTAQWGSAYGVTNRHGELSDAEVAAIIAEAQLVGIRGVDTHRTTNPAQGYGQAQSRLRPWAADFAVTTKVFGGASADLPVVGQLQASLHDLGLAQVDACLVHDWSGLDERASAETAAALARARDLGLARRIGVSIYEEAELERAVRVFDRLDVVQVASNPLDQRLRASALVGSLHDAGIEFQVRSVFLQGLLLDPRAATPLARHPDVTRFHAACATHSVPPLNACLGYAGALPWAGAVVIGVTSADELREIAHAWSHPGADLPWTGLASQDLDLLDPRRWHRA